MKKHLRDKIRMAVCTAAVLFSLPFLPGCNNTLKSYTDICLSHFGFDSIAQFKQYTFYIDNFGHRIFNADSLPYLSKLTGLRPTVVSATGKGSFTLNGMTVGQKDSFDFSNSPVKLVYTAENGKDSYSYDVFVNVHRQDPDLLQVHFRDSLPTRNDFRVLHSRRLEAFVLFSYGTSLEYYLSEDCHTWTGPIASSIELAEGVSPLLHTLCESDSAACMLDSKGGVWFSTDLSLWSKDHSAPGMKALTGFLKGRKYLSQDALTGISETDGVFRFARFDGRWTLGDVIPDDFPVSHFSICSNRTATDVHFIVVMSGSRADGSTSQSTWSTMDGLYWAEISDSLSVTGAREDASLFYYDNDLYLYGGRRIDANGQSSQDTALYVSSNHGKDWRHATDKISFHRLPDSFECRQITADDTYIWIFGKGKTGEVWRAHINKLLFEK